MRYLLGYPGANQPFGNPQQQQQGPQFNPQQTAILQGMSGKPGFSGAATGMLGQNQGFAPFGGEMVNNQNPGLIPFHGGEVNAQSPMTPGGRVQSIFGPTGVGATPLQRQSLGGIEQFLNQQSPESRTMDQLNPGLMGLFNQRLGIPDNLQNALAGQLGGQNPLAQSSQDILSQMVQGANPLPGQAQNALNSGLNTDLLGGGVRELLMQLAQGGGASGGFQNMMQGGAGADVSAIRGELARNPNEQLLSALQPRFEQNLAMADQAGGRFGSANALGRAQATNDFNLMASQALQQDLARRASLASALGQITGQDAANQNATRLGAGQTMQQGQLAALNALIGGAQGSAGVQQGAAGLLGNFGQMGIGNQQGAAQMLGNFAQMGLGNQQNVAQLLGNLGLGYNQLNQAGQLGAGGLMGQLAGQAGQNDFSRLLGGFGAGTTMAQQNDVETQRNIGILMNILGGMQGATLGAPVSTTPTGAQSGAQIGGAIGQILGLIGGQNRPSTTSR